MSLQSFRNLFDNDLKVIIPMIQRDYAQGRKNEGKIREGFTESLDRLIHGEAGSLDFIYGATETGSFTPLDGQQRLTTLFLLYWLAAKREDITAADYEFLRNFSYRTRPNSRYFCEHLIDHKPAADGLVSDDIRRQKWYRLEWNNDPTVDSMLRMLDFLDSYFYPDKENIDPIWNKLGNIQFYCYHIENLGLTDDIYIKMNSRGKLLTSFEHFKAAFDKATSSRLADKLDITYTDRMWQMGNTSIYTERLRAKNPDFIPDVDTYLLNFIHVVSRFITLGLYGTEPSDDPMDWITGIYSSPAKAAMLERAFDAICTDEAAGVFDIFLQADDIDPDKINLDSNDVNLLENACINGSNIGRVDLFMLYAVILYLCNHNTYTPDDLRYISRRQMRTRLRILRNLLKNSDNEFRPDRYPEIFKEVGQLILKGTLSTSRQALNEHQKKEEIAKAAYIKDNPHCEAAIAAIENHPLLMGALSAIGWTDPKLFNTFRQAFSDYSSHSVRLTRAILCHGDFTCSENGWRYRIGVGSQNNRSLWRNVLFVNRDNFRVKDVLPLFLADYATRAASGLDNSDILRAMIRDYTPAHYGHISLIIKYDSIMDKARFGKFYINDDMGWVAIFTEQKPGRNWAIMHLAIMEANEMAGKIRDLRLGEYCDYIQIADTATYIDATKRDAVHVYELSDGEYIEMASYPLPEYGTTDMPQYIVGHILPIIQPAS